MSIEDAKGNTIIRLSNVHEVAFKVAIYFAPIFAVWLVHTIMEHDKDIAILKTQMASRSALTIKSNQMLTQQTARP